MRILLDECVPRRLKRHFRGHELILTVTDAGLSGYTNGELLRRIEGKFDVFITVDKSIQHQQNLPAFNIAFILLRARSNDFVDIEPFIPRLLDRLTEAKRGELLVLR